MKTNEMSLQEMQQTNGGNTMPAMNDNSGDLTIRQAPDTMTTESGTPVVVGQPDPMQPGMGSISAG